MSRAKDFLSNFNEADPPDFDADFAKKHGFKLPDDWEEEEVDPLVKAIAMSQFTGRPPVVREPLYKKGRFVVREFDPRGLYSVWQSRLPLKEIVQIVDNHEQTTFFQVIDLKKYQQADWRRDGKSIAVAPFLKGWKANAPTPIHYDDAKKYLGEV